MMQSFVVYGRLLTRAVFNGVQSSYTNVDYHSHPWDKRYASGSASSNLQHSYNQDPLQFITASSGFPKDLSTSFNRRGQFGDDACFMTVHHSADVIGEFLLNK